MKLKFIESGRISDERLNQIFGGAMCQEYMRCTEGKGNYCRIWEQCTSETDKKNMCGKSGGLYQIPVNAPLEVMSPISSSLQITSNVKAL